ncbi:hypothetical protein MP228_006468 [Amoeboaphelidium protococcarum]|nr:hypothetical protein MP228_006468 [Amoeboaphelidium protococcarum]
MFMRSNFVALVVVVLASMLTVCCKPVDQSLVLQTIQDSDSDGSVLHRQPKIVLPFRRRVKVRVEPSIGEQYTYEYALDLQKQLMRKTIFQKDGAKVDFYFIGDQSKAYSITRTANGESECQVHPFEWKDPWYDDRYFEFIDYKFLGDQVCSMYQVQLAYEYYADIWIEYGTDSIIAIFESFYDRDDDDYNTVLHEDMKYVQSFSTDFDQSYILPPGDISHCKANATRLVLRP